MVEITGRGKKVLFVVRARDDSSSVLVAEF